jgi:hypothetical protein
VPTASELQAMQSHQWGLALLIDGIEEVFVDHSDLVGYNFTGSRTGVLGLSREGLSLPCSIDIRGGQGNADVARFTIHDFDGSLARLFGAIDDSEEDLGNVPFGNGLPITPDEDLAARTELHDKFVGTERIGPAGERHLYGVPPGFGVGLEHGIAVPALDLAGSPVTDNPIVWAGRRVCLYRIYRDHATYPSTSAGVSSWRPFDERALLWFGTLKDQGTVSGRTWRIEADGWSSWLRKPLGIGFQTTPVPATGAITLSTTENANETGIGVQLREYGQTASVTYGGRGFAVDITGVTADEIRADVQGEIAAAAAAATDATGGAATVWEDQAGYHVMMANDSSILIQVAEDATEDPRGLMALCLHRRVWAIHGYDVELQASYDPDPEDPRAIQFEAVGNSGQFASFANAYGPDYWVGTFYTGQTDWTETGGRDNDGNARTWSPQFTGGVCVLNSDLPPGGQTVYLADAALGIGATGTSVAHPGQLDLPPLSDPDDASVGATITGVGTVNRQGLFLFFGKRRYAEEEEEFDEYQIGRCSWVAGVGGQAGLVSGDTILVHEWLDPRLFGFQRGRMLSDWVARADATPETGQIQAVPICSLTYRKDQDGFENAAVVMQRLLHTTGTSDGWDSFSEDDDATLQAGDNEPTHDKPVLRDAEIASLGVGVSEDFVQSPDAWSEEVDLIEDQTILEAKVAFSGGYQALDVFANLMAPVGWCWQLRGGQLGVFCPAHPLTLADVEVVLDRSNKASTYAQGGAREGAEQQIRAFAPIDKFEIAYNWAPYLNRTADKAEQVARDAGFRYRNGTVKHSINGHFNRKLHGWHTRTAVLSTWWARRHFWVKGWPVHLVNPGELIWPGTIVRLTDPELTDPAGEYSVTNRIGIVTATYSDFAEGSKRLDILVLADRSNTPRLHGPIARGWGYDTSTRRLYLRDNEWQVAVDGWADASQFIEPEYTGITQFGGDAIVVCKQWDGVSWTETLRGEVESIDTTEGAAYIQLANGSVTGTYLRDQDTIVVLDTYDDQNASEWPTQIYGVVCDEDGEFDDGGGLTAGFNWEP